MTLTQTHKGVNYKRSKYVTQVQQQRPETPTVTLTWHASKYNVHKLHHRYILSCLFRRQKAKKNKKKKAKKKKKKKPAGAVLTIGMDAS